MKSGQSYLSQVALPLLRLYETQIAYLSSYVKEVGSLDFLPAFLLNLSSIAGTEQELYRKINQTAFV